METPTSVTRFFLIRTICQYRSNQEKCRRRHGACFPKEETPKKVFLNRESVKNVRILKRSIHRKGDFKKTRRCSSILTTEVILDHTAPPLRIFNGKFLQNSKYFFTFFHFSIKDWRICDHPLDLGPNSPEIQNLHYRLVAASRNYWIQT